MRANRSLLNQCLEPADEIMGCEYATDTVLASGNRAISPEGKPNPKGSMWLHIVCVSALRGLLYHDFGVYVKATKL